MNEVDNCFRVWKEDICVQFPRSERPLEMVRRMELEDFQNSPVYKSYTKVLSFQDRGKLSGIATIKMEYKKNT